MPPQCLILVCKGCFRHPTGGFKYDTDGHIVLGALCPHCFPQAHWSQQLPCNRYCFNKNDGLFLLHQTLLQREPCPRLYHTGVIKTSVLQVAPIIPDTGWERSLWQRLCRQDPAVQQRGSSSA